MKIPSMRHRGHVSLAAFVLALGMAGAACSPAADNDDSGGGGGDIKNPGVLTVATDDEPEGLDPAACEDNGLGRTAIMAGYDRLLDIDPAGTDLIPSVATEVPTIDNGGISADGLTYTFTLRDDVKFHDGSDLTAEDVVYSWERVITMNLPEGQAENFATIESVSAPDATTFVVS